MKRSHRNRARHDRRVARREHRRQVAVTEHQVDLIVQHQLRAFVGPVASFRSVPAEGATSLGGGSAGQGDCPPWAWISRNSRRNSRSR